MDRPAIMPEGPSDARNDSHRDTSRPETSEAIRSSRRGFLLGGLAAGAMGLPTGARAGLTDLMCPPTVQPPSIVQQSHREILQRAEDYTAGRIAPIAEDPTGRWVSIRMNKRPEIYRRQYFRGGAYIRDALDEWNWFCRDGWGTVGQMDPGTLDLLWEISQRLGVTSPFTLTSGYRSRSYNAQIRRAAKDSLHIQGQALDISHPDVPVSQIHAVAVISRAGGIGRYRSFVHVDTGRRRFWSG